jgi:hypothetical protein
MREKITQQRCPICKRFIKNDEACKTCVRKKAKLSEGRNYVFNFAR